MFLRLGGCCLVGFLFWRVKGLSGSTFLRYASEKGNDAFNTSLEQSFVLTINRMSEGYEVEWGGLAKLNLQYYGEER